MKKRQLLQRIQELTAPVKPKRFAHPTELNIIPDIQCITFDFYGTMFTSDVGDIGTAKSQAGRQYFLQALQDLDLPVTDKEMAVEKGLQQFQQVIEKHKLRKQEQENIKYPEPDIVQVWQETLAYLLQQNILDGPVTEDHAMRMAVEFECRINPVWPVPHLSQTLDEILDHGIKLGIISNSQFYTPLTFEALMGQATHATGFETNLQQWSYKAGLKKPSPQLYRRFTEQLSSLNIAAQNVLYVGNDLFKDMIPAKQLNMKTALYVGDRRSVRHSGAELSQHQASVNLIINDLHQILECLG